MDEPVAMVEASTADRQYYHTDAQGSVVAMTDDAGAIVEQYSYDPYGQSPATQAATGNPYRYTGRRLDPETGLYYYRVRYYHPTLGRFLQTDPIGYGDGMNLYAYVGNDPVNFTDPTGLAKNAGDGNKLNSVFQGKEILEAGFGRLLTRSALGAAFGKLGQRIGGKLGDLARKALGLGPRFRIDQAQLGKKLGQHVRDFGGNPSKLSDRQSVTRRIIDIGRRPDRIVDGTFRGQGPNNTRGPVQFRIKDRDVVVTTPRGDFVTILKNGIENSSVKNALGLTK